MLRLAALAVAACSSSHMSSPDGSTPPATSYGVGVKTRMYVDTTRPTPANGSAPDAPARTLLTEIWYPAPSGTAAPETVDAPLAPGPFPLVIFVHGSGTGRRQSTFLMQALAAAGNVVVAADFPLTASSTPGGASDLHVEDERGDVAFLADQAAAFSTDPADALHGATDPGAGYAVVGHSTGGAVALLAAFGDTHDDRVRAAVTISGDSCFFAEAFFRAREIPLFALTGSNDLLVPPPDNARRTYDLAAAPKVFASLVGGEHMYFTDYDIPDAVLGVMPTTASSDLATTLAHYGDGAACEPIPAPAGDPEMDYDVQHDLAARLVVAYLDHTLLALAADPRVMLAHDP